MTRRGVRGADEMQLGVVAGATVEDVQALAQEYWRPEAMSAASIGPKGDLIREAVAHISPELKAA